MQRGNLGPATLILLRHGQSLWNQEKTFTGWTDIGLSERGKQEAIAVGRMLVARGYRADVCFTSLLSRASETLRLVLAEMERSSLPIHSSWRLNERHYGALQELSFWEGVRQYGLGPVLRCQRRYQIRPPLLSTGDPRFPGNDARYAELDAADLPRGESLQDTLERVRPYWHERIAPELQPGKTVLVVSHRNTLRSLIKHIAGWSDAAALRVRVPTATPIILEVDENLQVLRQQTLKRPELIDDAGAGAAR
ncbi:MAG TPA: 2,3-bisphosphoglycerate-dependent phosphoglycerate mutase [Terriglobales bacterium]|nr:2,3-bisphosphoglycerate-dependent phosphoglycerate mutase [Terriglobales bacterium]